MHGIVRQASIIIIVCKASYCVVTIHNKLKHLDIQVGMHVGVCCTHHTDQAVSTYFQNKFYILESNMHMKLGCSHQCMHA